ncbi:hypothetical protein [Nocardia sp. NPDC004260]
MPAEVVWAPDVVDLVAEIVLKEVATPFGQSLNDHRPVGDLEQLAAEPLNPGRSRFLAWTLPIVRAAFDLCDRADITQLSDTVFSELNQTSWSAWYFSRLRELRWLGLSAC